MVGRQRGVGERSGGRGVEVADRDREPRRREDHVFGEAAVATQPAAASGPPVLGLAQVLLAEAAARAAAAAPGAVDEDRVADPDAVRALPELRDRPGHLVAERERELVGQRAGRPVHQVQVGVAQPCRADLEQHLAGPRLRTRDVAELGGPLPGGQLHGSHGGEHSSFLT